jgi:monoamine oxidase
MSWPTHPHTLGSYATYKVGQLTTICGAEGERVGNLHFAGEHTSVEAQGYMEGAAATGAEVALAVAEALGVPAAAMARSGVVSLAASRILMRAEASRAQAPGRRLRRLRVPA